jgi:hypothetical protein
VVETVVIGVAKETSIETAGKEDAMRVMAEITVDEITDPIVEHAVKVVVEIHLDEIFHM